MKRHPGFCRPPLPIDCKWHLIQTDIGPGQTPRADAPLDGLERAAPTLKEMPERGHFPPELDRIAIREYREIHFKPYRILYAIHGDAVVVHCVLDGRRDMQSLLEERLLR